MSIYKKRIQAHSVDTDLALEPRVMFDGAAAIDVAQDFVWDAEEHDAAVSAALPEAPDPVSGASIYVIDAAVDNAQQLIDALPDGAEVLMLDRQDGGFNQIADFLQGRDDVAELHIFSHGEPGALVLGGGTTTLNSVLGADADALERVGQSLTSSADILIYGCDFGAGETGVHAMAALAALTGADISASDDVTGAAELGGNWQLEVSHGEINAFAVSALSFSGTLAVEATDGTFTVQDIETAGTITLSNDGGAESTTNVSTPRGVEHMVERVWTFTESVDTGNATIVLDASGITGTKGSQASDFAIILGDTADLSGNPLVLRASGYDAANELVYFHNVNIENGAFVGFATQTETDNIEIEPVIVLDEEGIVDLGLVVQPALTDGGKLPDTFDTAVGFRPADAGTTPTEFLIPAGTTNIIVTGFSNEPDNTSGRDDRNDDYQTLNVSIDLSDATSSGTIAYIIDQGPSRNDQFGWTDAPLGTDVLTGGTVTGNLGSNISPTFTIENGVLQLTENTGLQTSYLVEFQTTLNTSANFLGSAAGLADKGDTSDIVIEIPAGVDVIKINQTDAAAGSSSAIEYKGFSKHYVDVATQIGSGATMAQLGETDDRVGAFAYENYALGTDSLQDSSATITGDTGSTIGANNDLTYFINGDGDLVIQRDSAHAGAFSSLFTVEFYERVEFGSSADSLGAVSDEAFFDANPTSGEAELSFVVPEGAQLGIMNLSLGGTNTSNENENTGGSFAIIDLSAGTTSGNFFTVRVSNTVDLLSWEGVPFGTTMFDVVTGASTDGEASSNKSTLNQFRDEFGARARFEIETAADGSQTVKFITDSQDGTQSFLDYNAFAQVQWLGSEPIKLTGLPAGGSFNIGEINGAGEWVVDIQEAADEGLFFTPPEHFSGSLPLTLNVSVGPESDDTLIIQRPVLDDIGFASSDATGDEDTDISISDAVTPTFEDDDGSETVTATQLSDLTVGHTVSDGANSFTASAGNTSVDVSAWDLSTLIYRAGPEEFGDFDVTLTIDYQDEGAGQVVTGSETNVFTVHVLPVNDPPVTSRDAFVAETNVPISGSVSVNDFDPEGEALTYAIVTPPPHGTLAFNPDGSFTYTGTIIGAYDFTYQVTDASGATTIQATNRITVQAPVAGFVTAVNDAFTTNEDVPLIGNVISNGVGGSDTVVGLTIATLVNPPNNGAVTFNADGSFLYTPDADYNNTLVTRDSFEYSIDNGNGPSTATVFIEVIPQNDAPVALPDSETTTEDTAINVAVLGNDSDVDGDALMVVSITAGINITPMIVGGTTVTFTPAPDWSGSETFTYTVQDSSGVQTTSTVTITVTSELDAPDSTDKTITIDEDATHIITFDAVTPANGDIDFIDPDTGDSLQSLSFSAPSSGTLLVGGVAVTSFPVAVSASQLSGGQVSFVPVLNSTATVTLDFVVNDGQLDDAAANTLTFNITPVNDPVKALAEGLPDQSVTDGQAGVLITTAGGFADVDGDSITYAIADITNAAGVSVTAASLGLTISTTTGVISTPGVIDHLASDGGPYVVTVEATSADTTTATQMFQLDVTNPVPMAANGGAFILDDGDTIAPIDIAGLFSDADGGAGGDALTITLDSGVLPGSLTFDGSQITGTIDNNASVISTFTAIFKGQDEQGAETTTSVSFTINNPAPTLAIPPVDLNQSNADSDTITPVDLSTAFIDDDVLTLTVTGLPPGLSIDAAGVVTGTLDRSASQGGVSGAHTVVLVARDTGGQETETSFTWIVTNPVPTSTGPQTIDMQDSETSQVNLTALFADSDADPLSYSIATLPTTVSPGALSIITSGANDVLQIVADTNASQNGTGGVYTVVVTADDGEGGTVSELITVNVTNPPPVVDIPLSDQTNNDADVVSVDISTLFADVDADMVMLSDNATLPPGLSIVGTNIVGTLTGDASQTGSPYPVTITATDSDGDFGTYTFEWTVENPVPIVTALPDVTTQDGQTLALDLAGSGAFSDPDGDMLTFALTTDDLGITVVDNGSGSFSVLTTADSSQGGLASDGIYTMTATATDADGASITTTFTVTVENPVPVSTGLPDQSAQDTDVVNLNLAALGAFSDGTPDSDTLTFSTPSPLPAGLILSGTGLLSGTLDHLASAGSPYAITIEASDGQGGVASASFVFTVTNPAPVISAPTPDQDVLNTDVINLDAGAAFSDIDGALADGTLDDLLFTATGLPGDLSIDPDTGIISGTVDDTQGSYSVFVTATDEQGDTATDAFIINLNNTPPVSTGIPPQALIDDQAITPLDFDTFFSDPDGDGLTYTVTGGLPAGLTLLNGVITGTPAIDASQSGPSGNGVYPLTVIGMDNSGDTAIQNFVITVANPLPTASALDDLTINDGGAVLADIAALGSFADEDPLMFTLEGGPPWVTLTATGTLSGTAPIDASTTSPYPVTVRAADADGDSILRVFNLIVTNPAPISAGLPDVAAADGDTVSIDLTDTGTTGFSDPDGDTLTYSTTSMLPDGLTLDATTGLITGKIGNLASGIGSYPIAVVATDADGASVSDDFTINVTNPAPTVTGTLSDIAAFDGATISIPTNTVFTDQPDGDSLAFQVSGLPDGLSIDETSGVISGTLPIDASLGAPYLITVLAEDEQGAQVETTFSLVVANIPPVAPTLPDIEAKDAEVLSINVTSGFTDADGDENTFTVTGLPAGLSFDPATGVVSGAIATSASQNSPYTVTVTADDAEGGTATATFTINVSNPVPIVENELPDVVLNAGTDFPVTSATLFSDPDGDTLTVSVTGLPSGLTFDPTTGLITGTLDATLIPGTVFTVVITGTDIDGAAISTAFDISVGEDPRVMVGNNSPLGDRFTLGSILSRLGFGNSGAEDVSAPLLNSLDADKSLSVFGNISNDLPIFETLDALGSVRETGPSLADPSFSNSVPIIFAIAGDADQVSTITANVIIGDERVFYQISGLLGQTVRVVDTDLPSGVYVGESGVLILPIWLSIPFDITIETTGGDGISLFKITVDPQQHQFEVFAIEVRDLLATERLNWMPSLY